ncbi:MAG: hypothetical protein ABIA74_03775 [bacterium]
MYSKYYQSHVKKSKTWFIIGSLKNEENLAFVRTLDKKQGILEYFVPESHEQKFLNLMNYFIQKNLIFNLEEKKNRLKIQ